MNKCLKCRKEFEGKFCPDCGTKWQDEKVCPKCGTRSKSSVKFCNQCGFRFPVPTVPPAVNPAPVPVPAPVQTVEPAPMPVQTAELVPTPTPVQAAEPEPMPVQTVESVPAPVPAPTVEPASEYGYTPAAVYTTAPVYAAPAYASAAYPPVRHSARDNRLTRDNRLGRFLQYFPAGLLLLFSLLLWAFYAAPVFKIDLLITSVEGNLYQIYGEEFFSDLCGPILALYIFTALCIAGGIAALYFAHMDKRIVPVILSAVFYLVYLILGIVLVVYINKYEMSAGACPILILVFAGVFALFAGAGFFLGQSLYPPLTAEERAAQAEERRRQIAEAQAKMEKPTAPEPAVKKPKKPSLSRKDNLTEEERCQLAKKMERHIQNKRIRLCFSSFMIFAFVILLLLSYKEPFWKLMDFADGFTDAAIIVVSLSCIVLLLMILIVLPIIFRKRPIKGWHPEKIYRRVGSIVRLMILSMFLALFVIPLIGHCFSMSGTVLDSTDRNFFITANGTIEANWVKNFPFWGCFLFQYNYYHFMMPHFNEAISKIIFILFVVIVPSLISIILEIWTIISDRTLSKKLCGFAHPRRNKDLVSAYEEELKIYRAELSAYKQYRRALTEYRYGIARYNAGKPYEGKPYAVKWVRTHKLAISGMAVGLAAVIAVTSGCFFGLYDFRFTLGKIKSIALGADKARVEAVLGEPDEIEVETHWYYYERKVNKRLDEINRLTAKIHSSSSVSESVEYGKKIAELESELMEMTSKCIDIYFTSDGKVIQVRYNSKQKPSDVSENKEVKSVTLSPSRVSFSDIDVRVSYQIEYKDGSYETAFLPDSVLAQVSSVGQNILNWSNSWGTYSATLWVE